MGRVRWFVRLRWMAVAGVVLVVTAARMGHVIEEVRPLYAIALAMAAFNAAAHLGIRRRWHHLTDPAHLRRTLMVHIVVDLVCLTLLLHWAGSIENPLVLLYLFPLIAAAILLKPAQSLAMAGLAVALVTGMTALEQTGILQHHHIRCFPHAFLLPDIAAGESGAGRLRFYLQIPGFLAVFAIVAFVVTYFTNDIMQDFRQVARREEEEEARWKETVCRMTEGVLCLRKDLKVDCCNPAARQVLGCTRDPVENCSCESRLPTELIPHVGAIFEGQEKRAVCEAAVGGRPLLHTLSSVRPNGGGVKHVMWLVQDLSQVRRLEDEISRHEKLATIYELSATLAHEIGNFVDACKTGLEVLEKESKADGDYRRWAREINEYVRHLPPAISGIIEFTRRHRLTFQPFEVQATAQTAIQIARPKAERAGVTLQTGTVEPVPPLSGDPAHFTVALANVILNAIDAAAANDRSDRRVTVSIGADGGRETRVIVSDTGDGIPEDIREKVFDPFFTTKDEARGTGLGLTIARRIVREHGGTIEVESRPGEGATFTLVLPRSATGVST